MALEFDEKISRLREIDKLNWHDRVGKSFLHAFVSCLSQEELIDATIATMPGTSAANGRWLKAIDSDPMHYSDNAIAEFWSRTSDERAARIIVRRADRDIVQALLPDFLDKRIVGWLVGRAVIRAEEVPEGVWAAVREHEPATYAYLCAKGLRSLSPSEAVQLVLDAPEVYLDGGRGLAIWSIGQLGYEKALEKLWVSLR